jgi:hypothetical protein
LQKLTDFIKLRNRKDNLVLQTGAGTEIEVENTQENRILIDIAQKHDVTNLIKCMKLKNTKDLQKRIKNAKKRQKVHYRRALKKELQILGVSEEDLENLDNNSISSDSEKQKIDEEKIRRRIEAMDLRRLTKLYIKDVNGLQKQPEIMLGHRRHLQVHHSDPPSNQLPGMQSAPDILELPLMQTFETIENPSDYKHRFLPRKNSSRFQSGEVTIQQSRPGSPLKPAVSLQPKSQVTSQASSLQNTASNFRPIKDSKLEHQKQQRLKKIQQFELFKDQMDNSYIHSKHHTEGQRLPKNAYYYENIANHTNYVKHLEADKKKKDERTRYAGAIHSGAISPDSEPVSALRKSPIEGRTSKAESTLRMLLQKEQPMTRSIIRSKIEHQVNSFKRAKFSASVKDVQLHENLLEIHSHLTSRLKS